MIISLIIWFLMTLVLIAIAIIETIFWFIVVCVAVVILTIFWVIIELVYWPFKKIARGLYKRRKR